MPTSTAPDELPPWAEGNYPGVLGSSEWASLPRRDDTGIVGLASAGLTPNQPYRAETMNEFLARIQEHIAWLRGEGSTGVYGDGSDGDVMLGAGTTTLTRDMYYDDLTVPNGSTLVTAGFRVFVAGTLTIAAGGVVHNDGGDASGVTSGAGGGAGSPGGSLGSGGSGATGLTNAGDSAGTAATAITNAIGGDGGAGGDAGAQTGGAGAAATDPVAENGGYRHLSAALGRSSGNATDRFRGGAGGGSGASLAGGPGTTGAGGGGGGLISIWARRVANSGTIRANGGAGGDAAVIGSPSSAGTGGGGGGGGGGVWIVHRETSNGSLGTVQANGGAGGAGADLGLSGSDGSAGRIILLVG